MLKKIDDHKIDHQLSVGTFVWHHNNFIEKKIK